MNTPCSLEHCHTNLFALQSLDDMKWKCFRRALDYRLDNTQIGRVNNYEDPVLIAYWDALRAGILCAWRRIPIDDGNKTERELWLFGTNDNLPSKLLNLRPISDAHGSLNESTMSYDCRSMLFKALHNMIENYLLSKGFARLNKWFVLPANDHSDVKVPNYSFNFNFFLHGDNKVCASVDVQRHKHIFNLTSNDLEQTTPSTVILAPYGISAMLIGHVSREIDVRSLRENWERNYPVRHLDNLPDFVEVSTGNARMCYPTCYVYKIGTTDPSVTIIESTSSTKKADVSRSKKSKGRATVINTTLDSVPRGDKIESSLVKKFANNLLISTQRTNCIDLDKSQATGCSAIIDPSNSQLCRCTHCIPINTRSSPFIPFHRRARAAPLNVSDSSVRPKTDPIKHDHPSESNETSDLLNDSTSSPLVMSNTHPSTNEKPSDWIATTPYSVGISGPPSVLAATTNRNSVAANSPSPNVTTSRGTKRSAAMALDDSVIDEDECEQHQQTYDFDRTVSFLQLPLKRFRADEPSTMNALEPVTTTLEHIYQHGQPTPPSPSHLLARSAHDFDQNDDAGYASSTPANTRSTQSSMYTTDGPSMADLGIIFDSQDLTENINTGATSAMHTTLDSSVKSPSRKENTVPLPLPPAPTIVINNGCVFPNNRSLTGVLHDMEQIYNTPPGSSSSDKLQALHSPYGIMTDNSSLVVNTFDTLNQFGQESILVPFESHTITEQSAYFPVNKLALERSSERYEPSKRSVKANSMRHEPLRHWKQTIALNDLSSSPLNTHQIFRQLPTPRSLPTPTLFSPLRSNDLQSSPYPPNRSIGSVPAVPSPIGALVPTVPEVDSLIFNVLLNDSILNFYRDINFDSCVLCACTPNELSIHGTDSTVYLERPRNQVKPALQSVYSHQQSMYAESQAMPSMNSTCSCGFSAVVNLRLSCSAGLFYEDECEITGKKEEVPYRQPIEQLPVRLLELIERKECLPSPFDYFNNQVGSSSSSVQKTTTADTGRISKQPFYQYENDVCRAAIDQARNNSHGLIADDVEKHRWLHQWSYSASPLDSDQQLITMLRSLQPLLVKALKTRDGTGSRSTIDGPLTWKSFQQLLYVQNQHAYLEEQTSGPQPIPYILAGLDREWIMLAPYSAKFWDKLCLEPYSKRKDIGYVCVIPDNDFVSATTKTYFRELSAHYELCQLGLHRPLTKIFPDQGILSIPSQASDSSTLPTIDPWFTEHQTTHPLGTRLKLYAQTLKEKLANVLATQFFDTTLSDDINSRRDASRNPNDLSSSSLDLQSTNSDGMTNGFSFSPSSSTSTNPIGSSVYTTGSTTTDALSASSTNLSVSANGTLVNGQQVDPVDTQAFESFYHGRSLNDDQLFFVIYLVDTFRYELLGAPNQDNGTSQPDEALDIYIKKALFRIYMDLIKDLPEKISSRINIQIIPFESIASQQVESDSELRLTQFKRLSLHVYDQLRRTISYTTRAKSLTGFGPSASEEKTPAKIVMQLYTPAYILSPKSDFRFKSFADVTEQTSINGPVLFCSYCLSDDQRYLLATCSDDRGELLETCSINIEVPDRHRRKIQHARRIGLQKLWDFILRIVTSIAMPWRIVIGRLGRLGHGELKNWGTILSKKNLVRCATMIRDSCPMCHVLRSHDHPVLLSACLVSMETHPLLTILPDSFELGEMRGTQPSNNNSTTMQNGGQILNNVSVTHILTLPTSATVQHVQAAPRLNDPRQTSVDIDDDLFGAFVNFDYVLDNNQSPPPELELLGNYGLEMNHSRNPSGQMSRLNSLSASQNLYNGNDPYGTSLNSSSLKSNSLLHLDSEVDLNDIPTLHQQPLALGFYVSTIGTLNPLPDWMSQGKSNQRLKNSSSVFKATLHVSVPNAQHSDDMLFAQSHDQKSTHPLDSNYTYVVLRHVLESYNRLSWLLIDAKTNERASCLPIHMETLLRLYDAFMKFV